MKKSFITLLCSSLLFTTSCSKDDKKLYNLFIGTSGNFFHLDSCASAGGNEKIGTNFIYINENPVSFYGGYSYVLQLNQWLKPGTNTFSIKGKSSKDLFIKVASTSLDGRNFKLLFKKHIKAGNIDFKQKFNPEVKYNLPLFKSSIPDDKNKNKEEISHFLNVIASNIDKKKIWYELIYGRSIWEKEAYAINDWSKQEKIYLDNLRKSFAGNHTEMTFNKLSLKYLWGKNSVYVYSGIKTDFIPSTYLFTIKKYSDNKETLDYSPACQLIKVNGQWKVWY